MVTQLLQLLIGPISIVFCGHLGSTEELDGAALAVSVSRYTFATVAKDSISKISTGKF